MPDLRALVMDKVGSFANQREAADFFEISEEELEGWHGSMPIPVSALEKVWSGLDFSTLGTAGKQKVVVMMSSYKTTMPQTAFSLITLIDKTRMAVMLDFGDAFIAHSRNKLAENFLRTKAEWAFSCDDDMVFPCGNAAVFNNFTGLNLPDKFAGVHAVDRLLSHGKTLIGGLYFGRWEHSKGCFAEGAATHEYLVRAPRDEIRPTRWVGTGCLLIHRSVFMDIEAKFPSLARNHEGKHGNFFTSSEHDLRNGADEALAILNDLSASSEARCAHVHKLLTDLKAKTEAYSSLGVGEDVVFCHRAAQAGHQPHIDFGTICGHIGTRVYGPRYA